MDIVQQYVAGIERRYHNVELSLVTESAGRQEQDAAVRAVRNLDHAIDDADVDNDTLDLDWLINEHERQMKVVPTVHNMFDPYIFM